MSAEFRHKLLTGCQAAPGLIAFPESSDPRCLLAAEDLLSSGAIRAALLFGPPAQLRAQAQSENCARIASGDGVTWVDEAYPELAAATAEAVQDYYDEKGRPVSQAELAQRSLNYLAQAATLLEQAKTDVVLAGAVATTADVIRAAIAGCGLARGNRTVSGSFLFYRADRPAIMYADAGVVIAPTPRQLVDIARESVTCWEAVLPDVEPVVAFLSFSTKGSASHDHSDKMAQAAVDFAKLRPDVACDGELQFDAAIDPAIGARKSPGSRAAGRANIFIFPDLGAANIAYKITQRLADYEAYGPILQGLGGVYSDLSRGSTVADIVGSALVNLTRARATQTTESTTKREV